MSANKTYRIWQDGREVFAEASTGGTMADAVELWAYKNDSVIPRGSTVVNVERRWFGGARKGKPGRVMRVKISRSNKCNWKVEIVG